jgi:hypothetical protein
VDAYELQAWALTAAIPVAGVMLAVGALRWARDALTRSPVAGLIGVALTAAAAGNLLVPRRVGEVLNRPIIALVLESDGAQRSGAIALDLLLLGVVVTALAARFGEGRQALASAR